MLSWWLYTFLSHLSYCLVVLLQDDYFRTWSPASKPLDQGKPIKSYFQSATKVPISGVLGRHLTSLYECRDTHLGENSV